MQPTFTALSLALAAAAFAGSAHAAPPANIANTSWTLTVNRGGAERLFIDTQAGPGAPGNAACRAIRGNLAGFVPVNGWYCPSTGRIHLLHTNVSSGVTMRAFTGNVSDAVVGQPLMMGGTVAIEASVFGDLGEKHYSAVQQ